MELRGILKLLCELSSWGGCGIRILNLRQVDALILARTLFFIHCLILIISRGWSTIDEKLIVKEASEVREHQGLRLIIISLFPINLFFKLPQLFLFLYVVLHV